MGHDPSRVGQVGPVASCGQVGDFDPSLVKSRNLSWVGQVRPADSCGQVRNIGAPYVCPQSRSRSGTRTSSRSRSRSRSDFLKPMIGNLPTCLLQGLLLNTRSRSRFRYSQTLYLLYIWISLLSELTLAVGQVFTESPLNIMTYIGDFV